MTLNRLIPNGFKRAIVGKVARWVGTLAGGAIASYFATHSQVLDFVNQACASLNSADAMKAVFGGGAVALLSLIYSLKDAKNVDGKMAVATSTAFDAGVAHAQTQAGQAGADLQAVRDETKIAAVAQAMASANLASKEDKATIVSALKTGTF